MSVITLDSTSGDRDEIHGGIDAIRRRSPTGVASNAGVDRVTHDRGARPQAKQWQPVRTTGQAMEALLLDQSHWLGLALRRRPSIFARCACVEAGNGPAPGGARKAKGTTVMLESQENTRMTRAEVFAALASRGADRAVVEFSGGNDEGGPDRITLYRDEEEMHALSTSPSEMGTATARADARLADALSDPVFEEYGTFAGDFDVAGEVIWEVDGETVQMVRDRSEYQHFEDYL